jgi:hypothetical protein
MRQALVASLIACAAMGAGAANTYSPSAAEVLSALSRRSEIPEQQLSGLLADCNATQASINFCAFRDRVIADLKLQHAVTDKTTQFPVCKEDIDSKLVRWEAARDRGCERSAARDYGFGSMKPAARDLCTTLETNRMIKRVAQIRDCATR